MSEYITRTTAEQDQFESGAVRGSQVGKPRYDLIPPRPLRRLAMLYARGAEEYGEYNWTKGQPTSRILASMMRHPQDYLLGDRKEDHLAATAWNAFGLMEFEGTEWDDLFDWSSLPHVRRD